MDEIGIKHSLDKIYGAIQPVIISSKCVVWGGVIKEYTHFKKHIQKDGHPIGFADLSKSVYKNSNELIKSYTNSLPSGNLVNRVILFQCMNIEPGEKIVLEFNQIGDTVK